MWYLILALLFGQGGDSSCNHKGEQYTVQGTGIIGGETDTPRPPRPPQPPK